jgi:DNA-binding transcriptional ArsR family regulator
MEVSNPLKTLQNFAEQYNISFEARQRELHHIAEDINATDTKKQVRILKALSDPTRLKIVKALGTHELCVCELMLLLDATQSTVSHHLRILKDVDLVSERRKGTWSFHKLTDPKILTLLAALDDLV